MAEQLEHNSPAKLLAGIENKNGVTSSDLNDGATMNAGNEVTIYSNQVPADKVYAWGAGSRDRNKGVNALIKADLTNKNSQANIEGDLIAAITDSEQRDVHARVTVATLDELREAKDDARTERPIFPIKVPVARKSLYLELRVDADSGSDGDELDASDSTMQLWYTDINENRVRDLLENN
jgi:hypothetical protein